MSTVSTLSCPRCGDPLESSAGGSSMQSCDSCDGALVSQSALQPLLAKLAEELKDEECLQDVILSIPDKHDHVNCPQCGAQMKNYGYLSSNKVTIDGCLKCCLLWTDADELAVMAALHARSMVTQEEMYQKRREIEDQDLHFRALRRIRRTYRRIR